MPLAVELLIVLLLILLNGALALSELAIISARKLRLQQRAEAGSAGAAAALDLAQQPNRFLSTVQIGITLVGIFAGAFGGATLAAKLSDYLFDAGLGRSTANALGVAAVVLAITYLSLVIGEIVPKRIALQSPETFAALVARPMRLLSRVASPVVSLLSFSTEAVLRLIPLRGGLEPDITEEEVELLLQQSTEAGVIEPQEQAIVSALLRLGDRNAGDVMTPRPEVRWIDLDATPAELREMLARESHERYPVCEGDLDRVVGFVALKDLVRQLAEGKELDVRSVLRPAVFIPESLGALESLDRIRETREPMAVVVDEHGGTAGVITLADIIAGLVGEFATADDHDEAAIVRRPDGSLLVDGATPVDIVKEELGVEQLPEEHEYATFAGFVLYELGRVPVAGDRFDWGKWSFEVVDMDGRRVDKVLVSLHGGRTRA